MNYFKICKHQRQASLSNIGKACLKDQKNKGGGIPRDYTCFQVYDGVNLDSTYDGAGNIENRLRGTSVAQQGRMSRQLAALLQSVWAGAKFSLSGISNIMRDYNFSYC